MLLRAPWIDGLADELVIENRFSEATQQMTMLNTIPNTLGSFQNTTSTPNSDRRRAEHVSRKIPHVAPIHHHLELPGDFTTPRT